MTGRLMSSDRSLMLLALAVLGLGLVAGLVLSTPATAEGPEDAPQGIEADALTTVPAPQVEYEIVAPDDHLPPPGTTGYLHVHVYDWITGRPIGGRQITIYNRDAEQVAQVTTTCQDYVEFDNLPVGPYRVLLEADPNWVTGRRSHSPGWGQFTPAEWVWVRPYWRVGVRFYELPNITGAGLRVYAYHSNSRQANRPREPVPGAAFTVYDASGSFVTNGVTGCGGSVDFNNLSAGRYRVIDANEVEGAYRYPPSGERWVSLRFGALTSVWFFTVPSPGPEATPKPPTP